MDTIYTFKSPAKINLFLQVTGKREDGYHLLNSLMTCIDWYDILTIDFAPPWPYIKCDHPDVPEDGTNIVLQAADLFFQCFPPARPLGIHIQKEIPVGAGLGGGSGNAAAILNALNQFYNFPLSKSELMRLGLSLGADVPFFIEGRPALARGIGEQLTYIDALKSYFVLVVFPGFHVPTENIFKKLNFGLTNPAKKIIKINLIQVKYDCLQFLTNDLESVTAIIHPEINEMKEFLIQSGAEGVLMTGSGPSVFGLYSDIQIVQRAFEKVSFKMDTARKHLGKMISK